MLKKDKKGYLRNKTLFGQIFMGKFANLQSFTTIYTLFALEENKL